MSFSWGNARKVNFDSIFNIREQCIIIRMEREEIWKESFFGNRLIFVKGIQFLSVFFGEGDASKVQCLTIERSDITA